MSLSQLLSVILISAVVGVASALDDLPIRETLPGQGAREQSISLLLWLLYPRAPASAIAV